MASRKLILKTICNNSLQGNVKNETFMGHALLKQNGLFISGYDCRKLLKKSMVFCSELNYLTYSNDV